MKKVLSLSLCAILLVSLMVMPAFAAGVRDLTAAKGTPTIDGVIDDLWATTEVYSPGVVIVDGGGEATAEIRILWDEDNLYVLGVVKDSEIYTAGGNSWENDCIEFFLDENNEKAGAYQADDKQIRLNAADVLTEDDGRGIVHAAATTADGYILEIAIPFKTIKGAEGTVIGFDAQLADNDGGGGNKLVATICDDVTGGQQYQNTSGFGDLKLIAAGAAAADTNPVTSNDDLGNKEVTNPKTGDNGFVIFAAAALLVSAAGILLVMKKVKA